MDIVSYSFDCKASPETACFRILSEEGLKAWWIGSVTIVEKDPAWPAMGTKMSWRAGGGLFKANIIEDARPSRVVMEVVTPGANSRIEHIFDKLPDGGTRYTKSVEPKPRSTVGRLLIYPLIWMLRMMIKKEVMRGAMYADAASTHIQ